MNMLVRRQICFAAIAVLTAWFLSFGQCPASRALAGPTTAQRKLANQCETAIRLANEAVEARKLERAVYLVKRTQQEFAKLETAADPEDREWSQLLVPLKRRMNEARGVLELEGFELPDIKVDPKPKTEPADNKPSTPAPADEPKKFKPDANNISFKHEIASILVKRCGGCHGGSKPKGDLSMHTFRLLARGVGGSAIIDPGDSSISEIIEVIRKGEMPKGGGKVSSAELSLLAAWIDQGAKFDGGDADLPLSEMVAAASGPAAPNPDAPAQPGDVAFSTHIAPVLMEHCTGCHGGQRPRNRLDLTSYERMMRGGMTGAAIVAGNPSGSLLIQKIKGMAADGARMPLNAAPLPAGVIADFEKWVAAGAKFDGPDPAAPVDEVAALAVAKNSTHEQLVQIRAEQADKNWRLALADVEHSVLPTENFLIYTGGVAQSKVEEITKLAEQQQSAIRATLGLPADEPLMKGNMTLFVFGPRFDYSEFAKMVERRQLGRDERGHWRYSIVDAYGCILPAGSDDDDYGLEALLAQQIAGATIAARSSAPQWFSEGVARTIAARTAATDSRVKTWDERLPSVVSQLRAPDDFMTGKLPPEDAAIASYGFMSALMKKDRQFKSLLKDLWDGQAFDAAFQATYKTSPAQMAVAWVNSGAARRSR
jgi:hypothetical protein